MSNYSTKFNVSFNFSGTNDLDRILKQLKLFYREVDAITGEIRDLGISFKQLENLVKSGELHYTIHVGETDNQAYQSMKEQALYRRPENLSETQENLKSLQSVYSRTPIYDLKTLGILAKRQLELQIDELLYGVVFDALREGVIDEYKESYRSIDFGFLHQLSLEDRSVFNKDDYTNLSRLNYSSYESIEKALEYYNKRILQLTTSNEDLLNNTSKSINISTGSLTNISEKESIADINAERIILQGRIDLLNEARERLFQVLNSEGRPAELLSYSDIKQEREYLERELQLSDNDDKRIEIQLELNNLDKIKTEFDKTLQSLSSYNLLPLDQLTTLESIEKQISIYKKLQNQQSLEEAEQTQLMIGLLTKKKESFSSFDKLEKLKVSAGDINSLGGREYRVKVSGMGFDALTDKIRDLQKLLNDTENPVTGAQRKDIEELIKIYQKWRKETVKSMDTVKKGWSSVKGVGDSVESITSALKGNGTAWEKVTAVIDGVLQVYDSFAGIVEIIQMLTKATQGHTAAKAVEAATVTEGAAMEVGASASVAEANVAEANTAVEAAAAETMKAHASIPWVGIAIGAGMVATMLGLLFALPKFADGGLAYGPTLGLFGEYAGASNNPEVVAPLSKLKGMLADVGGLGGGRVVFKIEGRTLVGVLEKESNHRARTR